MFSIEGIKTALQAKGTLREKLIFLSILKSEIAEMLVKEEIVDYIPVRKVETDTWYDAKAYRRLTRIEIDDLGRIAGWLESQYVLVENLISTTNNTTSNKLPETIVQSPEVFQETQSKKREYLPNKKYTPELFLAFQKKWDKLHSQKQAYDECTKEFQLEPGKFDSFIKQFRKWNVTKRGHLSREK